ncbi:MAG: protein-glutamate O-methyltransferase CheR [Firmicutes bacterium]|nr:protein-glutamate O-methyltransferase CheR [Bacillota bacterium]
MGLSYEEFKRIVGFLTGLDLSAYKSHQMDRRIHSLMKLWGLTGYDEYLRVLRTDAARFEEFKKKLTINVSEFYRNPERFAELAEVVLPELFRTGRRLRIWSAGCANGAEPYTVAIIIRESGYRPGAYILGTDVDRVSLRRAQSGIYAPNEVRYIPAAIFAKYFHASGSGFELAEEIRRMVEFRQADLLVDDPGSDWDLILCRNVVIYFTEAAKEGLYRRLCRALRPGGYLMVGGTEPLLNYKDYGLENPLSNFYQKIIPPERFRVSGRGRDAS